MHAALPLVVKMPAGQANSGQLTLRQNELDWLLNRCLPYGGNGHTVNNAYYRLDQPFDTVAGSSFRMVVDLSDMTHASAMNTTGQSGRPLTTHYDDMVQPWADVEYHPIWMEEEDILAHTEGTLVLTPEG